MTVYTDVFTSSNIYASEVSYAELALTANTTLVWPLDAQPDTPVVAKIMDVTASGAYSITMPSAISASDGETVLFNNVAATTFTVKDSTGTTLLTVASGEQWQLYLVSNTTSAGVWRTYQFAAGTSTANAGGLAGYGIKALSTTLNQKIDVTAKSSNYTLVAADRASLINWTGGSGTLTLTAAATLEADWFVHIRNSGVGSFTLATAETIDGVVSKTFDPGDAATIVCNGSAFYTVGFGQDVSFLFDHTVIDVTGNSNYTLTGSELNRISYEFIGVLGAAVSVIVPATVQQYWVANSTTGADLTIKTAAQVSATLLPSGQRSIYYCNGTDIISAVTAAISGTVSGGTF